METANESLIQLPDAILESVLTRLPLRSLLVSCCTSKSLFNLIENDPDFAKAHFARSESQLMIHSPENTSCHFIDLDSDITLGFGARVEIKPEFNLPFDGFKVTHSCNGLVLLESEDNVYGDYHCIICNPVTGEYVLLPETKHLSRNVMSAFFYCPRTKQFKVMRVFHVVFRADNQCQDQGSNFSFVPYVNSSMELDQSIDSDPTLELDILSDHDSNLDLDIYSEDSYHSSDSDLDSMYSESDVMGEFLVGGSNSWDPLDNLPFSPFSIYSPCYLDKATHWLCIDESIESLIVFFHFESHQFGEIPSPTDMVKTRTNTYDDMSLIVFNGFLSIFDSITMKGKFHIWIMRQYGVRDSWTKDFVIDTTSWGRYNHDLYWKPTLWRSNGEVVMICEDGYMLFYNLFKKIGRIVKHQALVSPSIALVHTPSIISLRDVMRGSNMVVLNVASRFAHPELHPHNYLELSQTFFN